MITDTLSPKPLFDWFNQDRNNRAKLRQAGYSDGRITNWKRRGIPRAEVGNIADFMGWTYEQYVMAAQAAERRVKKWRRAAALAALVLGATLPGVDNKLIAAPLRHDFVNNINSLHIVRRLLRRIFSFITKAYKNTGFLTIDLTQKPVFGRKTEGWNLGA